MQKSYSLVSVATVDEVFVTCPTAKSRGQKIDEDLHFDPVSWSQFYRIIIARSNEFVDDKGHTELLSSEQSRKGHVKHEHFRILEDFCFLKSCHEPHCLVDYFLTKE